MSRGEFSLGQIKDTGFINSKNFKYFCLKSVQNTAVPLETLKAC